MPGLMNDNQYGLWNNALNAYIPVTPAGGDSSFYDAVYLNKVTSTPQSVAAPVALVGNGLTVGTNQVVTSGGRVGFGRTPATYMVEVQGDVMATGSFRGDGSLLTGLIGVNSDPVSWNGAHTFNKSVTAKVVDTANAAVTDVIVLTHNPSNTPAANMGTGLLFKGKSSSTVDRDMARIASAWGQASDIARTTYLTFQMVTSAGALTEYARLSKALTYFLADELRIGSATNQGGLGNSSRLYVYGGANGANVDIQGNAAQADQAVLELESSDYDTTFKSLRFQIYGTSGLGSTFGYTNNSLGLLAFQSLNTALIATDNTVPIRFITNSVERAQVAASGGFNVGAYVNVPTGVINAVVGFRANNLAPSAQFLRGNGTNFVASAIQAGDLPGGFSGFANPTATVGTAAVNGSATTAMRSDAAPAIDLSMAPGWLGRHTFLATNLVAPDIGANATQRHTVPAVASDTLGLLVASQAFTNKTYNGLTITSTTGTLTVTVAKTLTVLNTLSLGGTDAKALTLTGFLTVGGDTTVTGGGSISLGGFTFTVPATGTAVLTSRTIAEGAGLAGNTYDLSANRTLAMGLPSTLSVSSVNSVSGTTHSHAVTSTSNPGAAAGLLASDAAGGLQLTKLGLGVAAGSYVLYVNGLSRVDNDLLLGAATARLLMKDTSTGWQVGATGVISPLSGNAIRSTGYTSGLVGWNMSDGGDLEANNGTFRGAIRSSILLYNAILASNGSQITTKSAAKLRTDVAVPSSPTYGTTTVAIDVVDQDGLSHAASQLFAVNDILQLKDGLVGYTWFKVSAVTDMATFWRYTSIIMAGSNGIAYRAGLGVLDYGSNQGFIIQTADQANSPYIQMATHSSTFTSQNSSGTLSVVPQFRAGNLNGGWGYAADTYGVAMGQYGATNSSWVTVDQTSGLRIGRNISTLAQWDISGNITIGNTAAGVPNILLSATGLNLRTGSTVRTNLNSDGSGWFANTAFAFDTSGNVTITANATIAGWAMTSTKMSSGVVTIASGVDVISPATNSSTAWFGRSAAGYVGLDFRKDTAGVVAAINMVAANGSLRPYMFLHSITGGVVTGRVAIGELNQSFHTGDVASNGLGMKIWDSAGTKLVEFSDVRNVIAGWTINAAAMASGSVTLASNSDVPANGTAHAWFGKGTPGYFGWRAQDASNRRIEAMANNGTIYPYFYVHDGTNYRVLLGGLNNAWGSDGSTTSMGMKIWSSAGTKLVEFSDTQNIIASWNITSNSINNNGVYIDAGTTNGVVANVTRTWMGYSVLSGNALRGFDVRYYPGSGTTDYGIQFVSNQAVDGYKPYMLVYDSRHRVVIGTMNYTWNGFTASAGMGMKIWGTSGDYLVEFSDTRNVIAGWTISQGSISSTGITMASGANAYMAFGTTPPTSASNGTGIFLDRTGLFGLASNVVQAKFDAATGKITAGAGAVSLDALGITIAAPSSFTTNNNIKWLNSGNQDVGGIGVAYAVAGGSQASSQTTVYSNSFSTTVGDSTVLIRAANTVNSAFISVRKVGSAYSGAISNVQPGDGDITIEATKIWINQTSQAFTYGYGYLTWGGSLYIDGSSGHVGLGTAAPNPMGVAASVYGRVVTVTSANATGRAMLELQQGTATTTADLAIGQVNFLNGLNHLGAVLVANQTGGASNNGYMSFFTTNAGTLGERLRITATGVVRFSNYGAGTLVTDASGNITASSDERMKNVLGPFTVGLDVVDHLHPIRFRWRQGYDLDTKELYVGFGAHSLSVRLKEAVGVSKATGMLTLQDRTILAVCVNSIKELRRKVKAAETRESPWLLAQVVAQGNRHEDEIEKLKAQVTALQAKVTKLEAAQPKGKT